MTDLETNKALALAIGWLPEQMMVSGFRDGLLICTEVATLKSEAHWRCFDYRDSPVIWPIAERFNAFPYRQRDISGTLTGKWIAWGKKQCDYTEDTPEKAVAMAVIGGAK